MVLAHDPDQAASYCPFLLAPASALPTSSRLCCHVRLISFPRFFSKLHAGRRETSSLQRTRPELHPGSLRTRPAALSRALGVAKSIR